MYVLGMGFSHDSSAVLLQDGRLVAGVEEERLNRVKHCEYPPIRAAAYCLREAGVGMEAVDILAVGGELEFVDDRLLQQVIEHRDFPACRSMRALVAGTLEHYFGVDVSERIVCVEHHLAHAVSAYGVSGFPEALVVTLDGGGDGTSGLAIAARGEHLKEMVRVQPRHSLGHFYSLVTNFLGYPLHDEYKVMGLSAHGDPAPFRDAFEQGIVLGEQGRFEVDRWKIVQGLRERLPPRRAGEPVVDAHRDIAAALQAAVERVALHAFTHLRQASGLERLCYAGGFAHNCVVNGKLQRSGLFEQIFVQPAASDAGLALGAALLAHWNAPSGGFDNRSQPMVYLGPDVGPPDTIASYLAAWSDWVTCERSASVAADTATALASGSIVGWVQGRCEFGARALGNRSILADPRPAANRRRINIAIKKREDYRPFAPAVEYERVEEFFEVSPEQDGFPHMSVALRVRDEKRHLLGAVTHVDGTARVQTVACADNPRFWRLIHEFGLLTSVPVLLNTSFNNHREPIVTTVDEAVACFLTTGLDLLVVGDLIVHKRAGGDITRVCDMFVALCPHVALCCERGRKTAGAVPVSDAAFRLLAEADGKTRVGEIGSRGSQVVPDALTELCAEVFELWSERVIVLSPRSIEHHVDTVPRPWLGSWA